MHEWAFLALVALLITIIVIIAVSSRRGKLCCGNNSASRPWRGPVYGEFLHTFALTGLGLPIVQPGASLVFPTPTVEPLGVRYVEGTGGVGLLVPQGTYLVSWAVNAGTGASVNLLVNGEDPLTVPTGASPMQFAYAQSLTTDVLDVEYLVKAPLLVDNLISLVNGGSALFTLDPLPNTSIGVTSIVTQIRVQRVGPAIVPSNSISSTSNSNRSSGSN